MPGWPLALLLVGVVAYSSGPGSCDVPLSPMATSPTPFNASAPPFSVTGLPASYQAFVDYPMQLTVPGYMKGVLIRFTDPGGINRGSFYTSSTSASITQKLTNCGGDTDSVLGHTGSMNNVNRASLLWTWKAPAISVGQLSFELVIVANMTTWWRSSTLVPVSAANATLPNVTDDRDCDDYCTRILARCQQFLDRQSCLTQCAYYPSSPINQTTGDCFPCRYYRLGLAETTTGPEQDWYCAQAGPTGGGACGSVCDSFCRLQNLFCPNTYPAGTCLNSCSALNSLSTTSLPRNNVSVDFNTGFVSGNSIECRFNRLSLALSGGTSQTTFCPQSSVDGGGVCGAPCAGYCDIMEQHCSANSSICLSTCSTIDTSGSPSSPTGNTIQCRTFYAQLASQNSSFCPLAADTSTPCEDQCPAYCSSLAAVCSAYPQFANISDCLADCAARPWGQDGIYTADTTLCRQYFLNYPNMSSTPQAACAKSGPTGGGTCGDKYRPYCSVFTRVCSSAVATAYPTSSTNYCIQAGAKMNYSDMSTWSSSITTGNTMGCRWSYLLQAEAPGANKTHLCGLADWSGGSSPRSTQPVAGQCGNLTENYCFWYQATCPILYSSDFTSLTDCLQWADSVLAASPGSAADQTGDTFYCRVNQLEQSILDIARYGGVNKGRCPRIGRSGGVHCSAVCDQYCSSISAACSGPNLQYPDLPTCLAVCRTFSPTGGVNGSNLPCRTAELALAIPRCSYQVAGPAGDAYDGGSHCGGLCDNYCANIQSICTSYLQYPTTAQCLSVCATGGIPLGPPFASNSLNINTMQCRMNQLILTVNSTSSTRCRGAGFGGYNQCGPEVEVACSVFQGLCPTRSSVDIPANVTCAAAFLNLSLFPVGYTNTTNYLNSKGNTLQCRLFHAQLALLDGTPDNEHCDSITFSGGDTCGNSPSCSTYCSLVNSTCPNAVYAPICSGWCAKLPQGALTSTNGNSVGCRQLATASNCSSASFSGGGVCGDFCENYCSQIQAVCTGPNQQYAGTQECVLQCRAFDTTDPFLLTTLSGPTLACRSAYLQLAIESPSTHCLAAGPTGGSRCGTPCNAYCDYMLAACPGTYLNRTACQSGCAVLRQSGSFGATAGDTLQCRFTYAGLALNQPTNAAEFCASASLQSVPGVCPADNGNNSCPSGSLIYDLTVDVATKASYNPSVDGYPQAFRLNGQAQINITFPRCACIRFDVPGSCFHPFYIVADGLTNVGGDGYFNGSITPPQLRSVDNYACNKRTLIFFANNIGVYGYQCNLHRQMGALIIIDDQNYTCGGPPRSPPAPPPPIPPPPSSVCADCVYDQYLHGYLWSQPTVLAYAGVVVLDGELVVHLPPNYDPALDGDLVLFYLQNGTDAVPAFTSITVDGYSTTCQNDPTVETKESTLILVWSFTDSCLSVAKRMVDNFF